MVFLAAAISVLALGTNARAQPTNGWSEQDIVRMARARAPQILVSRQRTELARAKAESVGRPPDPRVFWRREETFPENKTNNEDIVALTWPLDVSGRRRGQRALAQADVARTRVETEVSERAAIAEALSAFYDVVASRQRVDAAEAHVAALEEVERILAEREASGAASGYARARLGIEADLARSGLSSRRAEARRARMRLRALVAPDARDLPAIRGSLATGEPPDVETLVERAKQQHPALRHASASKAAADRAVRAADTAWIPTVSLTGGYKVARTTETQHGYTVGVGLAVPIFSGDRGLEARAGARRRLARARAQALFRRLRVEIIEARSQWVAAREELARFERATGDRLAMLLRGARVSYEEGRRSSFEVLDAQRAARDVRLRRIALALEAKRAEIALERATGGWR